MKLAFIFPGLPLPRALHLSLMTGERHGRRVP